MRRLLLALSVGGASLIAPCAARAQTANLTLTAVPGVKVGHHTIAERPTGCTAVLVEGGATAGVDVRGAAPATRETDLLKPVNLVQQVYAIGLSGGSAFGLDARSGIMRYLDEKNIGFKAYGAINVPIVPAASLFDLDIGANPKIRPTADCGYRAAQAASTAPVAEGNVGAGAGATVGKSAGASRAMKGGIGSAGDSNARRPDRRGACRRSTRPATSSIPRPEKSSPAFARQTARRSPTRGCCSRLAQSRQPARLGENTTLGVVATNATLTKTQATKIARDGARRFRARALSEPHDGRRRHDLRDRDRRTARQRRRQPRRRARGAGRCRRHRPRRASGHGHSRVSALLATSQLNLHLAILIVYSLALMALGALDWPARARRSAISSSPAARLGPGLIFATMLAANIGAGSTVGATALRLRERHRRVVVGRIGGHRIDRARLLDRAGACGARPRRINCGRSATTSSTGTTRRVRAHRRGDSLDRIAVHPRGTALGDRLDHQRRRRAVAVGWLRAWRSGHHRLLRGRRTADVGVGQRRAAHGEARRLRARAAAGPASSAARTTLPCVSPADPTTGTSGAPARRGSSTLAVIVPPFIVSPGLLQKIFGARDDRAVRVGVGLNALGLFALRRRAGGARHHRAGAVPDARSSPDPALPMLLVHACRRSSARSASPPSSPRKSARPTRSLFMLTTSLSQDFYKRFVNPSASDDGRCCGWRAGRRSASGALGTVLAIALGSVVNALTIFYTLIGVSLFVPVLAGLCTSARTSSAGALATMIAGGVAAALAVHALTGGRGWGVCHAGDRRPCCSAAAWVITLVRSTTQRSAAVRLPVQSRGRYAIANDT